MSASEASSISVAAPAMATGAAAQYSLRKILGIWALAALPMGVLGWVVIPAVSPDAAADPLGAGVARVALLGLGLVWLFALSLIIVAREEGNLHWTTVARRLRLTAPRDPRTGAPRRRLWLWVVPFLLAIVVFELFLKRYVDGAWLALFPGLREPPGASMEALFRDKALLHSLRGAWWFLALFVVQAAFNTFLGEEFLFRGVLLPKMAGVFGRWSWVANGVLHGAYHLHQPWGIAASVVSGWLYAFPSWRFRSTWMGVIVHSAQSLYFAALLLGLVLGLA